MIARKRIASKSSLKQSTNGLILNKPNDFFKKVCRALQKSLDLPFATTQCVQIGLRELHYVRETNPILIFGTAKPMPALPLYIGEQSAWLVVEVECKAGQPTELLQVSLKVHQGTTTETANLCFRAEWDMRDPGSDHAQPHWNVHAPVAEIQDEQVQNSFTDFVNQQELDTFATFSAENKANVTEEVPSSAHLVRLVQPAVCGFTSDQMHRFHFAMAVDWHGKSGIHSPELVDSDQMVQWIAACASYMKSQFAFMMSL